MLHGGLRLLHGWYTAVGVVVGVILLRLKRHLVCASFGVGGLAGSWGGGSVARGGPAILEDPGDGAD